MPCSGVRRHVLLHSVETSGNNVEIIKICSYYKQTLNNVKQRNKKHSSWSSSHFSTSHSAPAEWDPAPQPSQNCTSEQSCCGFPVLDAPTSHRGIPARAIFLRESPDVWNMKMITAWMGDAKGSLRNPGCSPASNLPLTGRTIIQRQISVTQSPGRHQAVIPTLDKHHLHCFSRMTIASPFLSLHQEISGITLGLPKLLFRVRKAGVKVLILTTLLSCSVCVPCISPGDSPKPHTQVVPRWPFSITTFLNRCDLSAPVLQPKFLSSLSFCISQPLHGQCFLWCE